MAIARDSYSKTYVLIIAFVILVTVSLIVSIYFSLQLTQRYVENEFSARKVEVLEHNIKPFNDFFQNRIPEISFYQGYLDSAGAANYADSVLRTYPFVSRITFYDLLVTNEETVDYGLNAKELALVPKGAFDFSLFNDNGEKVLNVRRLDHTALLLSNDFTNTTVKFASFIERVDTTQSIGYEDIFSVFYTINPGKISYMNIPRTVDIHTYKRLMLGEFRYEASYEQDIMTFVIDAKNLALVNTIPALYQTVEIRPLAYESVDPDPDILTTDTPLPGALANYKLYFSASRTFLSAEVNNRFFPVIGVIALVYFILVIIAYLFFRNMSINKRMFKLQYDFINNLTHEFKTPVSVIKIAGNNISQAKQLSDKERALYGRILDEEADKLNNLMNTLLSFTQIENKSINIKREQINLHEFCSKIVTASQLKYADMDLSYNVKTRKTLLTDPVLLGSVFQNLIDNAYKYSEPNNKVLKINIERKRKNMIFTFADKGIGIASKELPHIFKKFYRIQNQFNQQGSVGLGLAFCKELVNFMGGTIEVESEEGKGTVFTIIFPYE